MAGENLSAYDCIVRPLQSNGRTNRPAMRSAGVYRRCAADCLCGRAELQHLGALFVAQLSPHFRCRDGTILAMIHFVDSPPLTNAELNDLFFAAWESWEARDFQHALKRSIGHVCAYDDKRLVGFVNIAGDGGLHAFLLDVTVHPDFQRRGIGKQLVKEAVRLARGTGAEFLHVDFEAELERFYFDACGFARTAGGVMRLT